jgi:hypothetical protein
LTIYRSLEVVFECRLNRGDKGYFARVKGKNGQVNNTFSSNYQRFKDLFMSKREKVPKPVTGLDGVYSAKR